MSAGLPRSRCTSVAARCAAYALVAGLAAALAAVISANAGAAASTGIAATADSERRGVAATEKRCKTVRVRLRRNGKVVKRDGKPVYRRVRRCKKVPSPGCRFVKVKKRTRSGRVVKRHGKPVYRKVEKCPPKPKPNPGASPAPGSTPTPAPGPTPTPAPEPGPTPPSDLANRVLALAQHVPGSIDLFTSEFPNGADGLYPSGSAMAPAAGSPPTTDEARAQLGAYLNRWFDGDIGKVDGALALFDNDELETLAPVPTHRAAIVATQGTVLEPTLDYLTNGKYSLVRSGTLPSSDAIASSAGGSTNRVVTVNNRYTAERFEYLIGVMGHEFLHDDVSTPDAEEAVLNPLSGMTYMQVLSKTPELAYAGTELARQMNTLAMLFLNSREAGSPNSEIYAPTGLGVAPGSPHNAPDFWTIFGGDSTSAAASEQLRATLRKILTASTPIPATLEYSQATAELFANLNDNWLSDTQRAQISVLLQLVTVDEIAQATGLGQQQIIDTLALQPYLDAIGD